MNYELRCQKLEKKHWENPTELHHVDKGFSDKFAADFWCRVTIGNPYECWPWIGYIGGGGYGMLTQGMRSHKVAWCLAHDVSRTPAGKRLVMTCCNPACCNPAHIAIGRVKTVDGKRGKIIDEPALPIGEADIIRYAAPTPPLTMKKWDGKWVKR